MNIAHLQETRAAKIVEMRAATTNPERFDALESEVRALDKDIKRAATLAEFERQADAKPDASANKELRSYSVGKAIREAAAGSLTGLEREQHDELSKGREVRGVMIPTAMILGETRAMTTTTAADTVATSMGGMIDRLRPVMAIQNLGATIISGLTGNLDLPKLTGGPSAYWVAEDGSTTASDSTFDKVSLSPKTVSGEMYLSRRLMLQNGVALENVLRGDLAFILAQALDGAAILGGGTNQPSGIMDVITANATAETELTDIAADLIAALEMDDVTGTTGFLTNPTIMAAARKIKDTTDRNIPVSEIFHGERIVSSNQVKTITGTPDTNPLVFGAWSNLMVGYWSGIDILANPYTDASKGGLRLHAFLDADVAVRHPEAFAWKAI
ncbi:phage major capsid protein [Ciceribacter thiooxidans]|uniref:Phage major capsid protein n=1 Tax=Ciceribacter thiooxidans TaxID=1969821 RepID=A0ABV7I0D9_9HYPH|nr:phage major capsid protein [Ciceribacter thiooxidans]